ncbi:hypothetical protein BASA84_000098 [Batrachochytrium salamandrivorans]|nr:hypothetical protein BASA84_000098 [Batrachochytrium salamandrivorans]
MYLQYTNFVIKANHNKDQKDFLLSDVGTRETKTILQFWLVDGFEFPQLRDLALQVFGMFDQQNVKDWVDTETEFEFKVEEIDIVI